MPFDGIRNSALVRTLADVLDDLPDLFQKEDFSLANLPAHIEETVRSLAQLHADHHQNATSYTGRGSHDGAARASAIHWRAGYCRCSVDDANPSSPIRPAV
jgi:hypothetical protein